MKTFFLFFVTTLFSFSVVLAQVGQIQQQSNNNSSSSSSSSKSSGGSSDGCAEAGLAACCNSGCASDAFQFGILGLVVLQEYYLKNVNRIPHVVSVDLMPQLAYANPSSLYFLPRVRGNWGVISTDFRFTNMLELSDSVSSFTTLDWQILELNFIIAERFYTRLGSGIMYEKYSGRGFAEHFLGFDFHFTPYPFLLSAEFRIAKDYVTGATPRSETNIRFNYKLYETPYMDIYATVGVIYQKYYSKVNVFSEQGGLLINLH